MIDFDQLRRDLDGATPGPWGISYREEFTVPIDAANWCGLARVIVRMDNTNEDDPQGCANARLIAASPDLAKLALLVPELRYALSYLSDCVHKSLPESYFFGKNALMEANAIARAALAKLDEALK